MAGIKYLLVRVVNPERPDGGVVTHINGKRWDMVTVDDADAFYSALTDDHRWGMKPNYSITRRSRQEAFIKDGEWKLAYENRTLEQQNAISALDAELDNDYRLSQLLPDVLKRLGEAGWRASTESVVTHLGASESWVSLVNGNFSMLQRGGQPSSYKTITFTKG